MADIKFSIREGMVPGRNVMERFELLASLPTAREELPGFSVTNWMGVFAPAKTPKPVVDQIDAAGLEVIDPWATVI